MNVGEIEKHKKKINSIFKKNNVVLAYIFGSVARNNAGPLSDIDIAVLFSKDLDRGIFFDLRLQIGVEISKILKENEIDVICLNEAPPLLRHEVVFSGACFYSIDSNNKRNFEFQTLQHYEDFKYHLDVSSKIMEEQIKNGTFGKPLVYSNSKYLKKYVSSK